MGSTRHTHKSLETDSASQYRNTKNNVFPFLYYTIVSLGSYKHIFCWRKKLLFNTLELGLYFCFVNDDFFFLKKFNKQHSPPLHWKDSFTSLSKISKVTYCFTKSIESRNIILSKSASIVCRFTSQLIFDIFIHPSDRAELTFLIVDWSNTWYILHLSF